jgi:hypothetical protein
MNIYFKISIGASKACTDKLILKVLVCFVSFI